MYPPDLTVAKFLAVGRDVLTADEAEFRDVFRQWSTAEQDELWAAWQNPNTRPRVRTSYDREKAHVPQWVIDLKGSQVDVEPAGASKRAGDERPRRRWVETFGVEVATYAPTKQLTRAWWWLSTAVLKSYQLALIGDRAGIGIRQGNKVEMMGDLDSLIAPELGFQMSSWWHVSVECSVAIPAALTGSIEEILVGQKGWFDEDGDEGGFNPIGE